MDARTRRHGASASFWYFVWRKMHCMNKFREPSEWVRPESDYIDCGYCLDRYITGETK